ncbi:MAG: LLM class flavin-dependent oxidoreductase [Candidatus Bathyarchaeia archaeon]
MKFGVSHSPHQWWTKTEQFEEWILKVEEMGYDGIFVPDHYNLPFPPKASLVDAWTTLSYIAAKTSTVKIGSLVSPVPRWLPSQLAKIIASVDILSRGRVIAGFGAGFYQDEFVNYAPSGSFDDPRVRLERLLEGVKLILELWTKENVNFEGKYYTLKKALLYPKPIQKPHPPIWCGGRRQRILEITARYFNGWVPSIFEVPKNFDISASVISSPEEYGSCVERIKGLFRKFGREETSFTFGILGEVNFDFDLIEKYRVAGCQYYIVDVVPPGKQIPKPTECLGLTEKFAKEVMPSFK